MHNYALHQTKEYAVESCVYTIHEEISVVQKFYGYSHFWDHKNLWIKNSWSRATDCATLKSPSLGLESFACPVSLIVYPAGTAC